MTNPGGLHFNFKSTVRGSSNGRTSGFGPEYGGSNPSPRTILFPTTSLNSKSIDIKGLDYGQAFH